MIDSFSSQIKVAVRVRPLLPCDYKLSRQKGIKTEACVKPKSDGRSIALVKDQFHSKDFIYDQVFGHLETQQDVYDKGCRQLVAEFTSGYNACLLCYGQSGTGKTYTMFGNNSKDWSSEHNVTGVLQQSLVDIFSYIEKCRNENKTAKLYVSFYEIYLECVRDLLIPSIVRGQRVNLSVRECPQRGTYIEGLSIFEVEDLSSMYELLHKSVARRVTGEQGMNVASSRSHAIVRLVLEHEVDPGEDDGESMDSNENPILSIQGKVRKNVFTFGDLAGSERLSKSGSTGARLREAQNINKSISALGNCVQALAFASNKRERGGISASHIPFRDSKLTRLLADALSGNTKTYFISSVGPSMHSYTETLSTLTFASRAASVKKVVMKERASKDAFADLSREMFDWQWPAVYKQAAKPLRGSVDTTDWTYDRIEEEMGMSMSMSSKQAASMTLSVNDFLGKEVPVGSSQGGSVSNVSHHDDDAYYNDTASSGSGSGSGSGWRRSHHHHEQQQQQHQHTYYSPQQYGDNNLLFELASGNKDFSSPLDYMEESKDGWSDDDSAAAERARGEDRFLDSNLYLSFPPPPPSPPPGAGAGAGAGADQLAVRLSSRKAPPIPRPITDTRDNLIRYEAAATGGGATNGAGSGAAGAGAGAMTTSGAGRGESSGTLDTSISDELQNLSGEIRSLREDLVGMERRRSRSGGDDSEGVREIHYGELASSIDEEAHARPDRYLTDDGNDGGSEVDEGGDDESGVHDRYDDDDVLFTLDGDEGEGGSPLHTLERSIISCGDDITSVDKLESREHRPLGEFSIQELDDELDKINKENGLNVSSSSLTTPQRKKKELRFDLRSVAAQPRSAPASAPAINPPSRYDSSAIVDVSLGTSALERHRVPPPPPAPHPGLARHCPRCESLQEQVVFLESKLIQKSAEVSTLKEFIHLNNLRVPAASVRDDSSGVFF